MRSNEKGNRQETDLPFRERPKKQKREDEFEWKPRHKIRQSNFLLRLPQDLHEMFKEQCNSNGVTMTGKLRNWMRRFIAGEIE